MSRRRFVMLVEVELDDIPGTLHPEVTAAPEEMQPNTPRNNRY